MNADHLAWEQLEELRQLDQLLKQLDEAPREWLPSIAEHITHLLEIKQ